MRPKATFTKKDLIVVLGCVVFLVMNLGIITPGGRQRAKEMVCLSNLYKWGNVFRMYAEDNNGSTISDPTDPRFRNHPSFDLGIPGPESWICQLYGRYYKDKKLLLCPAAVKPWIESGEWGNKYMTWWVDEGRVEVPKGFGFTPAAVGSYGINDWCYNAAPGAKSVWGFALELCWRTFNVKGAHNIPLFSDCLHIGCLCEDDNDPPELEDAPWTSDDGMAGLARHCMNRHGTGAINVLFMDFSARKVGLKELWTLKWHREFDINGMWTIASFGGNETQCALAWDDAAPWMSDFPEY